MNALTPEAEQEITKARGRCEKELKFLCKGALEMSDWSALHDDIAKFLLWSGKKKLILVPRGHLKSSVVTIGYSIQSILQNMDIRILIANAVWDNARKFMWKMQEYLKDKSLLPLMYGNFESKRWNQDEFVVSFRRAAQAEATISTTGVEKAQASQHYDKIILDDLVVRENIGSRDQMDKVITFYKDTLDLHDKGTETIIIGTRWTLGDLYQHLIENESRSINGHWFTSIEERSQWRDFAWRPMKAEEKPKNALAGFDVYLRQAIENGRPLFPQKFCIGPDPEGKKEDLLELKANKGSFHFSAQQMNDPVDEESIEFKRKFYQEVERFPSKGVDMMFIDPAFTLKQSNDFTGIVVTRFSEDNIVYVMEAVALKREPTQLVQEIFKLWERYPNIIRTKVESNIAQVVMITLLKDEMRNRNQFYSVEEYRASTRENKAAKIRGMVPRYESGGFRFRKGLNILKDQLVEFPRSRHDDIIDALSQGMDEWRSSPKNAPPKEEVRNFDWWAKRIHREPMTVIGGGFYDITGRR